MTMKNVTPEAVEDLTIRVLTRHGADTFAARHVAGAIRRAEEHGNASCGLAHLEFDCVQLLTGRVNGRAIPKSQRIFPGIIHVDADFGFAQPAFAAGLPEAVDAARSNGIAALAVSRAHTCTALGFHTEQIAREGFIGISFTTASGTVAPPGGHVPVLGTNPVAMSVPDRNGGIAFQFDQCTSAANLQRVREAADKGEAIPEGWAVDAHGNATTDPHAALSGALLPAGGTRGFGIALMAEVLAAVVTHSTLSMNSRNLKAPEGQPHGIGLFSILLSPSAIAGIAFWDQLEQVIGAVQAQPGARMPGTKKSPPKSLIEVSETTWDRIVKLADSAITGS